MRENPLRAAWCRLARPASCAPADAVWQRPVRRGPQDLGTRRARQLSKDRAHLSGRRAMPRSRANAPARSGARATYRDANGSRTASISRISGRHASVAYLAILAVLLDASAVALALPLDIWGPFRSTAGSSSTSVQRVTGVGEWKDWLGPASAYCIAYFALTTLLVLAEDGAQRVDWSPWFRESPQRARIR